MSASKKRAYMQRQPLTKYVRAPKMPNPNRVRKHKSKLRHAQRQREGN